MCTIGCEALLRWNHPERGLVAPDLFIPLAEEIGLMQPIGEWVLREACAQGAAWERTYRSGIRVAVNLSARQFQQRGLAEMVADALAQSGLPPHLLELEVTETAIMADPEAAARTLAEIAAMGVSVALDDFGTGYSSLTHLRQLPIDRLKIDRSFVSALPDERRRLRYNRGRHRPGAKPRSAGHRRGGRDLAAGVVPARQGLQRGAGLPVRQARTGGQVHAGADHRRRWHAVATRLRRRHTVRQGGTMECYMMSRERAAAVARALAAISRLAQTIATYGYGARSVDRSRNAARAGLARRWISARRRRDAACRVQPPPGPLPVRGMLRGGLPPPRSSLVQGNEQAPDREVRHSHMPAPLRCGSGLCEDEPLLERTHASRDTSASYFTPARSRTLLGRLTHVHLVLVGATSAQGAKCSRMRGNRSGGLVRASAYYRWRPGVRRPSDTARHPVALVVAPSRCVSARAAGSPGTRRLG